MATLENPLSALDLLDTIEARRLLGPEDRMPAAHRGPHRLSRRGWLNFTERLERREEISAVLAALTGSRAVLDVGGGTGELTRAIAAKVERCATVEPHRDRVETLRTGSATIQALPGRAEELPFPGRSFDAIMAAWVLPYVDDLVRAVQEMIRVCDETDPAARIVLIGGGQDNELVSLLNQACVPLAGEPHDHQGFLLATAARILAQSGFPRLTVWRTESALHFSESSLDQRVAAAAAVLVDFWYEGHPRADDMNAALRPALCRHFAQRPHAIGDQGVVLIARPEVRS
ncbi:class I SAM-dependent methyltransferase [Streptomyces sp. NPDC005962]|uniref:class I SAM-dependent methyltransferase n=1 Tax=Streptomyces sp. NPDC005962 TaxID=3154466 RepID=UPI0033C05646